MDDEVNISIVGIYGTKENSANILINVYDYPIDPESIQSTIHTINYGDNGIQGKAIYNIDEWLTSLDGIDSGEIGACSMDGNVHVFDNKKWLVYPTDAADGLNDVTFLNPSLLYSAGILGEIIKISNEKATTVVPGSGTRLNAISGHSENCIYAVGDEGQILNFDGNKWIYTEPFTNINLLAVHCLAPDKVYVAGSHGLVWRWNGHVWAEQQYEDVTFSSLSSVNNHIYATAGKDGIFEVSHSQIKPIKQAQLYRINGHGKNLLAAGGSIVAWFDGAQWFGWHYNIY